MTTALYLWKCNCGRFGQPRSFNKACDNARNHQRAHERELYWESEQDILKVGRDQL